MFSSIKAWFKSLPAKAGGLGPVIFAHLRRNKMFYIGFLAGIGFIFIVAALGCVQVPQPDQPPVVEGG